MSKPGPLRISGQLWLTTDAAGTRSAAGHGRVALLRLIDAHGSISAAAREMGMSDKAARDAVDTITGELPCCCVGTS